MIALAAITTTAKAQLTIQAGFAPQTLVQNTLLSPGVIISNFQFSGNLQQIGKFNGTNSNIGINNGIIISTGNIFSAPGPNQDILNNAGTDLSGAGDSQLDQLTTNSTKDAFTMSFDFVAYNDTVEFNYVFASEEYPEYVNAGFNDVFAFFISGPGFPVGGQNIALIPGTGQPVTIDNVNDFNNSQYYIDNATGLTVNYDGFTVKLKALAVVQPCSTYTIRIGIADVLDGDFDSAVFLEAGSFNSGNPNVTISAGAVNNVNDSLIVEGCVDGLLAVVRSGALSDTTVVNYTIGGTATNGVDYTQLPDSIVFYPGDTSVFLNIEAFVDGIAEGTESIVITLVPNAELCLNQPPQSVTIVITNTDPIAVQIDQVDTVFCTGTVTLTATGTGGQGNLEYTWSSGETTPSITVTPLESTTYTVTVTDGCGNTPAADSVAIAIVCDVVVPNVFTPNGDNVNETFVIDNLELYPGSILFIYNRWGRKVYSSNDYKSDWDGGSLSEGVYYYTLDIPAQPKKLHGTVTILK